jgi:hypothetical protein
VSSNYRTRAIMRLPKLPERQRAFLIGLETITRDKDSWRETGLDVLAWCAGLSETTATRARDQLVASGLVEYRRGEGRGHVSAYRLAPQVDDDRTSPPKKGRHNADDLSGPRKGSHSADDLSEPPKGSHNADDLPEPRKGRQTGPVKVVNRPDKGRHRNPATSDDTSGVLSTYVLKPPVPADAAPDPARDPRTLLGGLGVDGGLAEFILAWLKDNTDDPFAYLMAVIGKGHAAGFVDQRRRELADLDDDDPPPPKPPWCGECDERTRLVGMGGDRPARCIRCHPLSVARPEPEPEPSGRPPWCGDPECDPATRIRVTDTGDGPRARKCPECYPDRARPDDEGEEYPF